MRPSRLAATATIALMAPLLATPTAAAATPLCFGEPATIIGTAGADELHGSDDVSDVIYGGGGSDHISGGDFYGSADHPDLLCGGPGRDDLSGSAGDDRINGGDGDDRLIGNNGADLLQGNVGADTLIEESISDSDRVNDTLRGGDGNDTLTSGWGRDRLLGNAGADRLTDAECDGPTLIDGGAGDDRLSSWSSSFEGWGWVCDEAADRVTGRGGTDRARVDRRDSVGTVERIRRVAQPAA